MKNKQIILDLLPLLVLCFEALFMLRGIIFGNAVLNIGNVIALMLLVLTLFLLAQKLKLGVLSLGLSIAFGWLTIAVYDAGVIGSSIQFAFMNTSIQLGNPFCFVLLIVHFIISRRYYFGILTKKYWIDFKTEISNHKS
jgi:hypothetical protein